MLTFSPPLGSATTLYVPPVPSHARGLPVAVYLKATFDSPELYAKAKSDGARVEVWTNFPVEGSRAGDWNAVAFTEPDGAQSDQSELEGFDTREDHTFYLRLRALLQDQIEARFQFTYRLVYPSGHVQWLGQHDNNGVLAVEQGLTGIDLAREWDVGSDGAYHLDSALVKGVVGQVLQMADWTVWAWDAAGIPGRLDVDAADVTSNALILLPRGVHRGTNAPRPLALMGDKVTHLHLSSDGTLSVQPSGASGRISFTVLEHSSHLLEEALSSYAGTVLPHNPAFFAVATHHANATLPAHLLILPIADACQGSVSIPLRMLQPLMSNEHGKAGLVFFSPDTRKLKIVRGPVSGDDFVTLTVDSLGDTLVVSPVEIVRADDKTWSLSLLAPTNSVSWTVEGPQHTLPTPPPSPPAREPLRPDSVPTSPIPSAAPQTGPLPQRPQHRRRGSLALARNIPARLLRAYIHAVFNVIFWFWNVFLRAVVVRLIGEGLPRRISDILGFALAKTSSRARSPGQLSKSEEDRALPPQDGARERDTPSAAELIAPHPKHASPRHQSRPVQIVPHVVFSAILAGKSAVPLLALQGDLPKGLHASLDGRALPKPTTVQSDDGCHLIEIAGLTGGGRLEVFFDL